MGGINYQTAEKIKNIKNDIGAGKEIKEIVKKYFTNSKNKLHKWLDTNQSHFNGEELAYLEYVINAGEVIIEKKDITPAEEERNLIATTNLTIANMTRKDRENFLLSDLVIEKLLNLLNNSIKENIEIPKELRNLQDLKIQNVRVSGKIYKEFVSICKENNVTITDATNLMFTEFIEKYKK
jgi:predicted nucleic acid-binding protein